MSYEAIRQDIVTAVEAAKVGFSPGYPLVIEYDNRELVNTQSQTDPFLTVEIKLLSGEQAALAETPEQRIWGSIILAAAAPQGTGTARVNAVLDWFYARLQRKSFGKIRTQMATFAPVRPHLGWNYYPAVIPFWTDQPS